MKKLLLLLILIINVSAGDNASTLASAPEPEDLQNISNGATQGKSQNQKSEAAQKVAATDK